jgi:CheY-like chemotaxis protein
LRLLTLSAAAKLNELSAAVRLASAMEALAKKLLHDSKNVSASTLRTLSHAVKVLAKLCAPEKQNRFVMPVRLLVIEDEPLARRAVVGALQLAFERPDAADDGATALKMVEARRYDAVFSDIEMPEMTGFEFCRQMRRGNMNAGTPVVFITSHVDGASRVEAVQVGGTDFIGKPFLPIEITVKALTLVYENRLADAPAAPELASA